MPAAKTSPPLQELTPRQRRSVVTRTLLRALAMAAALVVLYYVAPLDTALTTRPALLLVVCLAALAAIITWQIRAIGHSQYPGLRAIRTVAAVVPLYILGFAVTYYVMERTNGAYFSEPLTRTGALYFSMTVFSTVGFGDITAKTDPARVIVTIQMFFDLILLGFGARAFLSAVQLSRQRRTPQQPE